MKYIDIYTQADLDALIARKDSNERARLGGAARFIVWGSSHVEAWGSSHVEAWESSHVVARGSSHVEAWGSSHVVASQYVAVHKHGSGPQITGSGVVIAVPKPANAIEWCAFYGASIEGDVALLYKAVTDQYRSGYRFSYEPGTSPSAPDWDGGKAECGGGLHFCAHPLDALSFHPAATKFVRCPVLISEIAVHPNADYPSKIKAPRVCGPIVEVDRYGKPLAA
jgi:hypothetical protein